MFKYGHKKKFTPLNPYIYTEFKLFRLYKKKLNNFMALLVIYFSFTC